jgi:hypothetical protein
MLLYSQLSVFCSHHQWTKKNLSPTENTAAAGAQAVADGPRQSSELPQACHLADSDPSHPRPRRPSRQPTKCNSVAPRLRRPSSCSAPFEFSILAQRSAQCASGGPAYSPRWGTRRQGIFASIEVEKRAATLGGTEPGSGGRAGTCCMTSCMHQRIGREIAPGPGRHCARVGGAGRDVLHAPAPAEAVRRRVSEREQYDEFCKF